MGHDAVRAAHAFEQFIAADHLRVTAVADLHPGRVVVLSCVSAEEAFVHDAFQVALADQLEERLASAFDLVHIEHSVTAWRNQSAETALAFDQRQLAQVPVIQRQQVESTEPRRAAAEQQLVELRVPVFIQADDLAVQHRMPRLKRIGCWGGAMLGG